MKEIGFVFSAEINGQQFHIRAYHDSGLTMKSEDNLPHVHFFTEFHYLYEGYEKISIPQKKKEVTLKAGEICLIPRRLYHAVDTDDRVKRICFNLTASELFGTLDDIIVIRNGYICSVMARFLEKELSKTRRGLLFLEVICELTELLSEQIDISSDKELNEQKQKWIIEDHIANRFYYNEGIAALAAKLYLSEKQTRTLVKKFFGKDYKSLILSQRMELAEMMLQDENFSLEKIAEEVGYHSYSGFYLAYTGYFGVSPSEKREQLQCRIDEKQSLPHP